MPRMECEKGYGFSAGVCFLFSSPIATDAVNKRIALFL